MATWQKSTQGISYRFSDKTVHVQNDEVLKNWLAEPGEQSLVLAAELKDAYHQTFGQALGITTDSLAVELLGHVFVDEVADKAGQFSQQLGAGLMQSFFEKLTAHTEIIDCGEKSVDSNRLVWDALTPFKGVIFAVTE